jgi:hypothetical protein
MMSGTNTDTVTEDETDGESTTDEFEDAVMGKEDEDLLELKH